MEKKKKTINDLVEEKLIKLEKMAKLKREIFEIGRLINEKIKRGEK